VFRVFDADQDYLDLEHSDAQFPIPSWSAAHTPVQQDELGRFEFAFGWPLRTMRYTYLSTYSQVPRDHYEGGWIVKPIGTVAAGGIVQATDQQHELAWALQATLAGQTAMPLMPIMWPFVVSTIFWAVVWLCATGLFFAPSRIRRAVRKSRNQCINGVPGVRSRSRSAVPIRDSAATGRVSGGACRAEHRYGDRRDAPCKHVRTSTPDAGGCCA